jgi:putative transposase
MKGKRYTTEDKIRILREVDGGKSAGEVCREKNIDEQTFYRWKRTFGMMDISEARQLKELQKENSELKKMLAEWGVEGTGRIVSEPRRQEVSRKPLFPHTTNPNPGRRESLEFLQRRLHRPVMRFKDPLVVTQESHNGNRFWRGKRKIVKYPTVSLCFGAISSDCILPRRQLFASARMFILT